MKVGCWCAARRRAGPALYLSTLRTTSSDSSSFSEWITAHCSGPALEGASLAVSSLGLAPGGWKVVWHSWEGGIGSKGWVKSRKGRSLEGAGAELGVLLES